MGWKIVRDNVEHWARAHGVSGVWRPCEHPVPLLGKKLFEEAGEYIEDYSPDELYDLKDALDRLIRLADPFGRAAKRHEKKVQQMGLFEKLIEWSPVPAEYEKAEAEANGMDIQ